MNAVVDQVLVACPCGLIPLADSHQPDSRAAWEYLAAHVALNPTKCRPTMQRVSVPLALAKPRSAK